MKANLKLECIGLNLRQQLRYFNFRAAIAGFPQERPPRFLPWVAEMRVNEQGEVYPHYIYGRRDYRLANSKGSRGVYENFILSENTLYRVGERTSWKLSREYWAAVTPNGDIYELSDEEADEWLNNMI